MLWRQTGSAKSGSLTRWGLQTAPGPEMPPKGRAGTLLTGVTNLCQADRYGAVGQHPVPSTGKQGRALLAPSRPVWHLLRLGTALSFHTSTGELPLLPSCDVSKLCLHSETIFPAIKLLSRVLLCKIPPFSKPPSTQGARALHAFTTPRVRFWHVVNTYVCARIYFAGLDRKPRNDFSPRLHLVIQRSPRC